MLLNPFPHLRLTVDRNEKPMNGGLEHLMQSFHFDHDGPGREWDLGVSPWTLPPLVSKWSRHALPL